MNSQVIANYQYRIERALQKNLELNGNFPNRLHDAMCYAVFGKAKRLRPLLVYATAESFGAALEGCDDVACAIEFIHCYSLVHDDLPAMDNDTLRRGRNACHIEYDEATAILVGDALQSLAFECLATTTEINNIKQRLAIISELAKASGYCGMAGGQALDLMMLTKNITLDELEKIHNMKSGALLVAAVKLGALAANISDHQQLQLVTDFAKCVGLAFQIQDDLFDKAGVIGSTPKPCYISIAGLENAKKCVTDLFLQADSLLELLGFRNSPLADLTHLIKCRNN